MTTIHYAGSFSPLMFDFRFKSIHRRIIAVMQLYFSFKYYLKILRAPLV